MSGVEIELLLSKGKIEGEEFWNRRFWRRQQTADGAVEYSGFAIQPGVPRKAIGKSWIEDDMLCERWPVENEPLELCSVIFGIPEGDARVRWGDYVMVTDTGPHPFKLAQ